jgi:hypothetical protein
VVGPSAPNTQIDPIVGSGSYGATPALGQAVGVYRLLGGVGYAPMSNPVFPFPNAAPIAVSPAAYNKPEAFNVSENRVAYGFGMSEWCQNCHTNIHLDGYVTGRPGLRHPAGNGAHFRQTQADIYNYYVSSGNLKGNFNYTSLVPFESGSTDLGQLAAAAGSLPPGPAPTLMQATTSSNVMCISCHRAHASAFNSAVRWNMANTFITGAGGALEVGDEAQGLDLAHVQAAYYGRTSMGPFQRSLCNKCHAKD